MDYKGSFFKLILVSLLVSVATGAVTERADAKRKKIPPGQSILVMSKPGKDPSRFKERLVRRRFVIVNQTFCKKESFAIYEVQPKSGTVKSALNRVLTSQDEDLEASEIKFPSKTIQCTPSINDPEFPSQTHLQQLNFGEMRCLLDAMNVTQQQPARVTVIDSGITPIPGEMTNVTQYNFVDRVNGVPEASYDTGLHGTAVTCVMAAATNNSALFTGVSSHTNPTVRITSLRVGDDAGLIDTFDALDALTWCIDHQTERGGPGVINLSINSNQLPTYNGSTVVQGIAKSLRKHGDLIVNGAGNAGFLDPSKEKFLRRVGGLDETDHLWSSSVYGPFKAVAPVTARTWNTVASAPAVFTGTSLSAPCWGGAVALLMSLNPKLTTKKADKLVFKTGRTTEDGYIVPDLRAAVIKALKLRP